MESAFFCKIGCSVVWGWQNLTEIFPRHKQIARTSASIAVSLIFDTRMANFVVFLWWHYYLQQDCHSQGNVREKQKCYELREKSKNFSKSQGNSLLFSKSIKKGNLLVIKSNVLDQERNEVENKGR